MAVKNRTDLTNTLLANITDELSRQNTAARVREIIQDIIDSGLNSIDDAASPTNIYSTVVSIPSASVLTSGVTPVQLIAPAGADKGIVLLSSTVLAGRFNSVSYTTNLDIAIYTDTATDNQLYFSNFLNFTLDRVSVGSQQQATSAADTQIIANKGIYLKTVGGNPVAGNSPISVALQYIIIDL
jgi:hypothetical protein